MFLCVLGSGSKGNCTIITNNSRNDAILVDAGLSWKYISTIAEAKCLPLDSVSAIVITHEHTDHWKNSFNISKNLGGIPVYFQKTAYASMIDRWGETAWGKGIFTKASKDATKTFTDKILTKNFTIEAFKTSHDTAHPVGFIITEMDTSSTPFLAHNTRIGIATDLGIITDKVHDVLRRCDLVVLEANHDTQMLIEGSYPEHIKTRVLGKTGHLSNEQTAKFINTLDPKITKHVVLAHVSEENNSITKIEETFSTLLNKEHPMIHLASQTDGSSLFNL